MAAGRASGLGRDSYSTSRDREATERAASERSSRSTSTGSDRDTEISWGDDFMSSRNEPAPGMSSAEALKIQQKNELGRSAVNALLGFGKGLGGGLLGGALGMLGAVISRAATNKKNSNEVEQMLREQFPNESNELDKLYGKGQWAKVAVENPRGFIEDADRRGRDEQGNSVFGQSGATQPNATTETGTTPVPDYTGYDPSDPSPVTSAFFNQYNPENLPATINTNAQGTDMANFSDLNTNLYDMYNRGYSDISSARDLGLADIQNAVKQGRGDITSYYDKGRGDVMDMYQTAEGYYEPYRGAGTRALETLEGMMAGGPGDFYESPGYQFRMNEGIKAMERAASARGGTGALSNPRLYKELQEYGQGMATDEYDKFINRYYQSLTPYQQMVQGVGLPAAGSSADIAYNTGANLGNMGMTAGANLSNIAMQGGTQSALLRSNAAGLTSGLGLDTAKTATSNILQKEGLGTDWARLALAEKEAGTGRGWETSENVLNRDLAREMAEKGYAFYGQQNKSNQQSNFWNSLISGAGSFSGGYFK